MALALANPHKPVHLQGYGIVNQGNTLVITTSTPLVTDSLPAFYDPGFVGTTQVTTDDGSLTAAADALVKERDVPIQ